ncbi:hypothetical protein LCL87_03520 [Rhodococcus hoagii]|nr:hypothetical protein [Prescottella equi]
MTVSDSILLGLLPQRVVVLLDDGGRLRAGQLPEGTTVPMVITYGESEWSFDAVFVGDRILWQILPAEAAVIPCGAEVLVRPARAGLVAERRCRP